MRASLGFWEVREVRGRMGGLDGDRGRIDWMDRWDEAYP